MKSKIVKVGNNEVNSVVIGHNNPLVFIGGPCAIESKDHTLFMAEEINKILEPVHHSMFIESNPSPVKYAAKLLGLCDDHVRLPLVKVTDPTKDIVKKTLESAKLL